MRHGSSYRLTIPKSSIMIYLEPPFYQIEGVSIFADHADPMQFYYLPMKPHLTTRWDETLESDIPQLQLIKYRAQENKGGGFLNFDVNLGMETAQFSKIQRKIRTLFSLDDQPRLAPVPLVDGTVKLMILGRDSSASREDTEFVLEMSHHAKPALYGDNQASFSVELDAQGVVLIEKALQGELAPIGVVYSLDYLAMRPAYSVRVSANWERVQEHFEKSMGGGFIFFSAQVDEVVDELIENQGIIIEVDNFIPPGVDAAELRARLDQAVVEVKEMVLENFFEPTLPPMPTAAEDKNDLDKGLDAFERLLLISTSGGMGFKFREVDITRIDKKRLDVNMTERTTVLKSIHPQAHLEGLFRFLRDTNQSLDRLVLNVDLDDPWFQQRRVRVISRANFLKDNIESVNVKLRYKDSVQNTILDRNKTEDSLAWNSEIIDEVALREVAVNYEVSFRDVDSSERPLSLESPIEVIDLDNYEVRPHELYSLVPVPITALDFPWELFPNIEVRLRYRDPDNNIEMEDTQILYEQKPEFTWRFFRMKGGPDTFEYQLIFRAADHQDLELPWTPTDSQQLVIRDPFPEKRHLQIVPAFNWREVDFVFVDVKYEDDDNEVYEVYTLTFSEDQKRPKKVGIQRMVNPQHRLLSYRTTIVYNDGRVQECLPQETLSERAIITTRSQGRRIISVQPEALAFEEGIKEVEVFLQYKDESNEHVFVDTFSFRDHEDRARYFEFDFSDRLKSEYSYYLVYKYDNGLQRTTEWTNGNGDKLIFPTSW